MNRWTKSLAASAGLLAVASTVAIASPTLRCFGIAWAQETREFGRDAWDGNDGREGRDGRSGTERSVTATGSDIRIETMGEAGSDGSDGQDAGYPNCQRQTRGVRYNLRAADGGDGGDGGRGGNGGGGGNVTVYYDDPNALRRVYVQAEGGVSGRGGRGGRGTDGCDCYDRSWEVETCNNGNCRTERYTCTDGQDGRDGRMGSDGARGQAGMLTVINQLESLAADVPTQTIRLSELSDRTFNLSRNLWRTQQGAVALLAPGSVVNDEYREFAGRVEKQVQLVWDTDQSITPYLNQNATVELTENQQIFVDFTDDLWVDARTESDGDLTTVAIANLIRAEEATDLNIAEVSGWSQDLTFAIVDLASKSDIVATDFTVSYRVGEGGRRRPSNYRTRYEGTVPADLVQQNYNRFVIDIGRLPIDAEHLTPGTYVEIEVVARRSLGNNSAEKKLEWQGRIER